MVGGVIAGRAAVIGTGLIGGSVAIALRAAGWDVAGWDPDPGSLAQAVSMEACRPVRSRGEAIDGADLVVLAGPVNAIVETLAEIDGDALVTDVAGVKGPVVAAATGVSRFVGGHPMAGRETSGPAGASGSMFRGATWVLTSDGTSTDDVAELSAIVRSLGANPLVMPAARHDAAVAVASHLPHVTAAALVEALAGDEAAFELAAGGFRDLTRVALSDPGWWVDVLVANRIEVAASIRSLAGSLDGLAAAIESQDRVSLAERLGRSRRIRAGMAAPVETVAVVLEDEPGEMARVGHALSESQVDLRDLQLRHAVHGGGGVLTLSVRAGESVQLASALAAEGFRVVGSP